MTIKKAESLILPPTILSFVKDLPNLCSLGGLACTLVAIYFSILGEFSLAMIGMIWAVAFDWADGLIARRLKGRSGSDRVFGGQLDLVIDIVSYGVAPAVLLLSYSDFNPVFLPGAFLMLAASAIRLSFFSTFGLSDNAQYTGLALDNNNVFIVFLFLFEGFFSQEQFSIVLYGFGVLLASLNVAQIKTPKLSSNPRNVVVLSFYTLVVTAFYAWSVSEQIINSPT